MNRLFPAGLLLLATPAPVLAQGFEGVQTFRVTNEGGKSATLTQMTKGSRVRMDMSGMAALSGGSAPPMMQGAYMLMDWKAGTVRMVMPPQKMYMSMQMDSILERAEKDVPADDQKRLAGVRFENTGKVETVAGIRCEVWRYSGTANEKPEMMDACLAKGAGFMASAGAGPGRRRGPLNPEMEKLMRQGYGVVKMSRTVDGKPNFALELVSSEKKTLPASEFEVPSDYRGMDMGSMMPGPGAPGGPGGPGGRQ
jgi:hypothetical protein